MVTSTATAGTTRATLVRVMVHDVDPALQSLLARLVERGGMDVRHCTGPGTPHCPACPVLVGEGCPAADEVDAIVFAYHATAATSPALLDRLRSHYPDMPMIVVATGPTIEAQSGELDGCTVLRHPVEAETIWRTITELLGSTSEDSPSV